MREELEYRVPKWNEFQNYKKRRPPWIKNTLHLLDKTEYIDLTPVQRSLLHGIWLLYATTQKGTEERDSTDIDGTWQPLSVHIANRWLGLSAKIATWESLNHAGFIDIRAAPVQRERTSKESPESETGSEVLSTDRSLNELDVTQKPNTDYSGIEELDPGYAPGLGPDDGGYDDIPF